MNSENNLYVKQYHLVLRGTPREMGRQQGAMIKDIPQAVAFFASGPFPGTSAPVDSSLKLIDKYCPGMIDEMTGFCEAAGFELERLAYLAMTHIGGKHCSQFVVLPESSANGHTLVGRNYDFSEKVDDMKLTTVFPTGGYASFGFPTLFFGRNDGLNEHGLSVTMTAGGMPVGIDRGMQPPIQNGLQFWALVRTILDTCKTVDEAEECIARFPCAGNPILIVADKSGKAIMAEIHGPDKKIICINGGSGYQAATNHYQSPEMRAIDPTTMNHSMTRLTSINRFLADNAGKVTLDGMKNLLATRYPAGPCAHFYSEWFGTLHSLVFDVTDGYGEVTFGSPAVNPWHRFDFIDPKPGEFDSILPDNHTTPDFWAPVS
ncbi:choloylglycine hydrolase [Leptolinea sp. HRD-7]|nr:choloylglycine hydrolase [Leptolinea sp. HRD-7]